MYARTQSYILKKNCPKKVPRKSVPQSESSSDNSTIVYRGNETLFRGNILIQELTLQKVSKTKAVSFFRLMKKCCEELSLPVLRGSQMHPESE